MCLTYTLDSDSSFIVLLLINLVIPLIIFVRFSIVTACLNSMFLSGPFHGKFCCVENINFLLVL